MSSLRRLLPSSHSLTMRILRRPSLADNLALGKQLDSRLVPLMQTTFGSSEFGSRPISGLPHDYEAIIEDVNRTYKIAQKIKSEFLMDLNVECGTRAELNLPDSEVLINRMDHNLSRSEQDIGWISGVMKTNNDEMSHEIKMAGQELCKLKTANVIFYEKLKDQGQEIHDNFNRLEREVGRLNSQLNRTKYDVVIWGGAVASVVAMCITCSSYIHSLL